ASHVTPVAPSQQFPATQAPPQTIIPAPQLHWPSMHVSPGRQPAPQAPQLRGSLCAFVHAPAQRIGVSFGQGGSVGGLAGGAAGGASGPRSLRPCLPLRRPPLPRRFSGSLPSCPPLRLRSVSFWPPLPRPRRRD